MKYLLTGSSGFLGQVILNSIKDSEFITLGRSNCDIITDLVIEIPTVPACDIVIHAAGKAHSVPRTDEARQLFFKVNVTGTLNLLRGIERNSKLPQSFVFISSVAVYGVDNGTGINESSPLAAIDAYGKSKIEAEQIIQDWCAKHNVKCTILRLPLIAGPNPPGNLQAMIRGIEKNYYFNIAGGNARKSMVLAKDVAQIIPKSAQKGSIYNLTDGHHPSFFELSAQISKQLGISKPYNIPKWLAKVMARTGDLIGPNAPINTNKLQKLTSNLTFDDSKARRELGWNPDGVLEMFELQEV